MAVIGLLLYSGPLPAGTGRDEREGEVTMAIADCCECDAAVTLDDGTIKGEILPCADCGVELEVVSLDPVKLEPAPREEEDGGE